MTKTIAYIRVSTADQSNSLEIQEAAIRQYCQFRNLPLDQIIIDEDVSGHKEIYSRPGGTKLQSLPAGSTIITIKIDRIFRNAKDALITIDDWNSNDIALHVIDMGGASFTTKTAVGRLLFTTLVSFAEFERNSAGERTKAVLQNRKSLRKTYSANVFGYDNINGAMQQNLTEQAILAEILALKQSGTPEAHIATEMNRRQHKSKTGGKFYQSTIRSILNNPLHQTL